MVTLYLITNYKDEFVALCRRRRDADNIYSPFGDSITEINFDFDEEDDDGE